MKAPLIDVPDVDTFGSNHQRKIKVWSTERFLACVDVICKVDLPPEATWKVLTHVDNHKVFRDLKYGGERKYHKRGLFETVYDVNHIAAWSVLWFKGEFVTRLRITENRRAGQCKFQLLSSNIMKDFDGTWSLQPCTQAGLDKLYGKEHNPFEGLARGLPGMFGGHTSQSLIEFQQNVHPKSMPPALKGLARRIATGAMKRNMDDLEVEAKRIKAGKATLPGFEQWADKALVSTSKKKDDDHVDEAQARKGKRGHPQLASCTAVALQDSSSYQGLGALWKNCVAPLAVAPHHAGHLQVLAMTI